MSRIFFLFLISVLHPFEDYFSSYETDQSVGGRKQENPEKKNSWQTRKQNFACLTWPVWGSNLHQTQRSDGKFLVSAEMSMKKILITSEPSPSLVFVLMSVKYLWRVGGGNLFLFTSALSINLSSLSTATLACVSDTSFN